MTYANTVWTDYTCDAAGHLTSVCEQEARSDHDLQHQD